MTTNIIRSGFASPRVFSGRTGSVEIVPFSPDRVHVYDLRSDDLPVSGVHDEFDIDEHIESEDIPTRDAVRAAGAWVADTYYPGPATLATLRLRAGLSQKELARRCGMEQPHISRYEAGKHEIGIFQAQAIANALGVTLDQLVEALRQSASDFRK